MANEQKDWVIVTDKKEPTKRTVAFPKEKKEAVFFEGKLSSVTIDGVKVLYPDGVHPLSVTDKDGKLIPEAKAKKYISAANAFVTRIDNNSVNFNKNHPQLFGVDMLEQAGNRVGMRIEDIKLAKLEAAERMKNAIAMKEARKKVARISPEMATIEGEPEDYAATMRSEEKRIAEAYGVSPNAAKPDGKLTDADLQKLYEAETKRLQAITEAKNKVAMLSGKYRSTRQ